MNERTSGLVAGQVVGHLDDLALAGMRMVRVDGHRICLVRTSEGVFALDQACPHEGYGLTTGTLDGELLTCAWHNWKFRVSDGRCVLGEEDVRTHRVDIDDDGTIRVAVHEPDPAELRPELLASLRRGIERDYVGQISRDVVRLLRADTDPGELIWEAVAHGAPRAEFGWGHSIASLTDCLGMVDRYGDDDRALPIVQALAGVAETTRYRPERVLPDPVDDLPDDPRAAFRNAVESERLEDAQALVRGAIHAGSDAGELRGWFTDVVSDHLLSYGHGAIYAQKAFQLLDRIGWDRSDTVLPHLVPTIVYATREDTLPYMRLFHRGLGQLDLRELAEASTEPAAGWEDDGRLLRALLGDDRTEAALAAGAALAGGASLGDVLDVVTAVVAERMLRYDPAGELDFHDDFGWLDITHGITYANAVRWHCDMAPAPQVARRLLAGAPDGSPDMAPAPQVARRLLAGAPDGSPDMAPAPQVARRLLAGAPDGSPDMAPAPQVARRLLAGAPDGSPDMAPAPTVARRLLAGAPDGSPDMAPAPQVARRLLAGAPDGSPDMAPAPTVARRLLAGAPDGSPDMAPAPQVARRLLAGAPDGSPDMAPAPTVDHVRLVLWTVFLANWTGRHEWHTEVGRRAEVDPRSDDLAEYGRLLQHESLLDGTTAFIVHAHAVKTSVAATEEALRLDSPSPLDAVARFLAAPRLERFVAANVTRSIDFLSGRAPRDG